MRPVSVVVVGASPLGIDVADNGAGGTDLADDGSVGVAQAMAARLGGRYDLIVPCGAAPPGEVDLHPLHVHRVPPMARPRFVLTARSLVDRLALDRCARGLAVPGERVLLVSSDPVAAVIMEWSRARRRLPHQFHLQGKVIVPGPEYGGRLKRRALGVVTRSALRRASGVRAVNEGLGRAAAAIARVPVTVIGTRVDTHKFVPRPDGPDSGDGLHAVMLGTLNENKNHAAVVRAWAQVLRSAPGARLVIAGQGPRRGKLADLIRSLGLERHVELVGHVPYRQVPQLLARARCLVQPSWSEGQPRVVLEAMACGLPVLCSDIPAHRELVPVEVGRLVPPGDADAWAVAITAVLGDPVAAGRMGTRARALAVERYDFEANLDRMAALAAQTAAEGDGPAGRSGPGLRRLLRA